MDADDIKRALNADAERFCALYLSNGHKAGPFWRAGDILNSPCSGAGSFVVNLAGPKIGLWFENGEPAAGGKKSGTLIDIIMAQRNINFAQALDEAKRYLGIRDERKVFVRPRTAAAPQGSARFISTKNLSPVQEGSPAFEYLVGQRGLSLDILRKYHVCDCKRFFSNLGEVDAIAFPIYAPKEETGEGGKMQKSFKVVAIKYLAIQRGENGKKYISQEAGGENHLFGLTAVADDARDLVICEGEIDAMTVAMCGFNAVSVPMGAHADSADGTANKANDWINNDFEFLNRFEKIRLCMDNDEVGKSAAQSLFVRLGVARTDLVEIPPASGKDPNECLALEGAEVLKEYILAAHGIVPEKLVSARAFADKLKNRLCRKFNEEEGLVFPYSFGEHFKVRMGEVSIITGYPGHGKTTALNDILVYYASNFGLLSCIASLEVSADRTLETLWRQACGIKRLVDEFDREIPGLWDTSMDFLDKHFYFFDNVGFSRLSEVLVVFEYAARRYGVKLFCLDSLMCLDVGEDDYDKQKEVMSRLVDFAAKFQCHVFVVCHPRKLGEKKTDSKYVPGPDDIAGSRNLKGLVHNIITFHRNLEKPTKIYAAQLSRDYDEITQAKELYDETVFIRKQREGTGELPYKYLWFDMASRQFRDKYDKPVRRSVNFGGVEAGGGEEDAEEDIF